MYCFALLLFFFFWCCRFYRRSFGTLCNIKQILFPNNLPWLHIASSEQVAIGTNGVRTSQAISWLYDLLEIRKSEWHSFQVESKNTFWRIFNSILQVAAIESLIKTVSFLGSITTVLNYFVEVIIVYVAVRGPLKDQFLSLWYLLNKQVIHLFI